MASMNTRLNIEKLDGNIVKNHGGSKQVGFKQLGPGVKTGVHGDSNDDTTVAQRRLEDKQPEEKTNMDCLRSTQQCTKSGVAKHLGVAVIQQHNGLVKETNVTLLAKVRCFQIQFGLSRVFWAEDTTMSTYLVNKSSAYSWDTVKVLQGDEFEVETQDGHTFEVEPHGNVDHVVGSQEYREDCNEDAFAVAAVEKSYGHESLTFNNTVVCEVISKWKARLKDDMDARSMCSSTVKRNAVTTAIAITGSLHQSGNTLRVSLSRIHNEKLVQTLLKGHSILSLEGSLSGDCDVEKNGKWSCIYAIGSQEYQMVCTRLDIAFADVDMLDKFDRRKLGSYDAVHDGYELSLVAGIATGALVKGGSWSEVPAQVECVAYRVIESYSQWDDMDYKRMACTGLIVCFWWGFPCVLLSEYLKDWFGLLGFGIRMYLTRTSSFRALWILYKKAVMRLNGFFNLKGLVAGTLVSSGFML
ncbi:hypothetical protein Tco_0367385 [Tanacetum coccineum]